MVAPCFLFSFLSFLSSVFAFTFTHSTPSECDDLTLEWEGGTGPFTLLFVPVFGTPRNVSIPATAITGGKGSFSTPVLFPEGQKLVLTMSDATGFGAGGSTQILTVEKSKGATCDSSEQRVAFSFQLNSALQQCRPFLFEGYSAAIQPVSISMVIPGGQSAVVRPPVGGTRFSWTANVAAGTSMIFIMSDSRGAQGGASDIRIVGASDDSSCINANSPSSTLQSTSSSTQSSTSSQTATPGASQPAAASPSPSLEVPKGTPISAIAGTVIGSLLFLAVIVTLGLFFLKNLKKKADKRKLQKQQSTDFHHSARKPSVGAFSDGRGPNPYGAPGAHYPYSPNSAAPFDNPFSDSTPMGNMSPDPNNPYAYQQQPDPFHHHQRPYYPPPPLVPPSQDPFNPSADSTNPPLPGAMYYSSQPSESDGSQATLSREPSSHYKGTMPVNFNDGSSGPKTQYNERRRRPSRGLSVTNPSPPSQNAAPANSSPFQ